MGIFFIYVSLILLFSLILKIKIYHPVVITHIIWFIVISLYNIIPSKLYPLSHNVYTRLSLYLFFFLMGTLFYYLVFGLKKKNCFNQNMTDSNTNILFYFVFSLTVYLLLRYFMMFAKGTTLYKEIVQGRLTNDLKVLFYFDKLSLVYFFYLITVKEKLSKKEKIFVTLFFITYFLKFSKMDVMQLFIAILLTLWIKKKIKIHHIILSALLMFFLLAFIHLWRVGNTTSIAKAIGEMMAIYFLSPITAFDMIVNNQISFNKYQTFVFLERFFSKIFQINIFNSNSQSFDGWVFVPYPTNVYTCMWRFYSDFREIGLIVFGHFIGFFWTFIYDRRYKAVFNLIYTSLFYILIFQFFSDILFGYFSAVLQTILVCLVVVKLKQSEITRHEVSLLFSYKFNYYIEESK